jgi:hypothetical protein
VQTLYPYEFTQKWPQSIDLQHLIGTRENRSILMDGKIQRLEYIVDWGGRLEPNLQPPTMRLGARIAKTSS